MGDIKHGMTRSPEYQTWRSMKKRCISPSNARYAQYGGRGITVCERWMSFENFFEDMGPRPSPKHSLDRMDNNRGYEPGNCRWATLVEQNRNKSTNVILEYRGERRCVSEWSEITGIPHGTILSRINRGIPIEKILVPKQSCLNKNWDGKTGEQESTSSQLFPLAVLGALYLIACGIAPAYELLAGIAR
ncbi:hypothetical protein LA345_25765 [Burkholderia vietnamiensis]|uniref:Uncharacterized protein n=2 Tax=Burkholderia vietnamiensis TaxID=60552 RepID=A4JD13_BURVG|nr:hypothetical protein Bcep1808_1155 [Burkholderia vietnamiensis G4]MCB4347294.1 hypothetical protein [Burkholderia vietnamiensis]